MSSSLPFCIGGKRTKWLSQPGLNAGHLQLTSSIAHFTFTSLCCISAQAVGNTLPVTCSPLGQQHISAQGKGSSAGSSCKLAFHNTSVSSVCATALSSAWPHQLCSFCSAYPLVELHHTIHGSQFVCVHGQESHVAHLAPWLLWREQSWCYPSACSHNFPCGTRVEPLCNPSMILMQTFTATPY